MFNKPVTSLRLENYFQVQRRAQTSTTEGTAQFKAQKLQPFKADWQLYKPCTSVFRNSPFCPQCICVFCVIFIMHQLVSVMGWKSLVTDTNWILKYSDTCSAAELKCLLYIWFTTVTYHFTPYLYPILPMKYNKFSFPHTKVNML